MSGISSAYSYSAAALSRLHADWRIDITDPQLDWTTEATQLAARAEDLIRNDPVICALLDAKISGTHGNTGLKFKSLYAEDGENETSDAEQAMRRAIDDEIELCSDGRQIDANGLMVRAEFEEAIDRLATSKGECFAVRKFIPGRVNARLATCWLIIQPYRISNPPGQVNGPNLYEGIKLDDNGAPLGIHIAPAMRGTALTNSLDPSGWTYVQWYDPETGAPNVIHRIGIRPPGGYRGITNFAPLMARAKQVRGVVEAYVVAKRIQACHPLFIRADDPVQAAKADRNGAVWGNNTTFEPGKVYYIGRDAEIATPNWSFNGADMQSFLHGLYTDMFSAWGLPICVVLGQMSSGSNQAARSDWMQYYRTCTRWQDDHIEQVSRIIDESIVREGVARGRIPNSSAPWTRYMRGRYVRPPKNMPDPLKEAQAIEAWAAVGRDLTSLYADAGLDFRESIMQRAEDDELMKAQGVPLSLATNPQPSNKAADDGKPANASPDDAGAPIKGGEK